MEEYKVENSDREDIAIASAQVICPDKKTLDEVIAELRSEIAKLRSAEAQTDGE